MVRDVVTGPGKVAAWRERIGTTNTQRSSSGYNLQAKRKGTGHCSGHAGSDMSCSWLVTGTIGAGLAAFSADRAAARRLAPPGRPGAGATAAGKTAASNTNHRLQNSPAGLTIDRDLETKETAVRP